MKHRDIQAAATLADPRWAAVIARDPRFDGRFFYAVRTTGVYCRPSCASRPARPEHVSFHATARDAERAGFRPCRRCHPDRPPLTERNTAIVADLCRYIDASQHVPSLAELSRRAGLSPHHLHRMFRATTGVTPGNYAAAARGKRLRCALESSRTITDAIYEAGFNSSGRFYEASARVLGMTPTRYRNGGAGSAIEFALSTCSLGWLLAARSDCGLCAILLGEDRNDLIRDLRSRFPSARILPAGPEFGETIAAVVQFVEAPARGLDLPLDIRGSVFQQRVWEALRAIPAGSRISYSELARRIGAPRAVRAVAAACAANPLAVAVPCHRVVRSDGGLSGYRWGVERKRALLEREAGASTAPSRRRARS